MIHPSIFIEKQRSIAETNNDQSSNVYTPAHTVYKKRNLKRKYDINKIEYFKRDNYNQSVYSNTF